jgi:hypothetical protein
VSYTFRSPQFEAVPTTGPLEACSLGKGASIRTYCDPLKALWADEDLVKLETGSPGGIALGMTNLITDKLLAMPIGGISPQSQVFLAFRDQVKATKNDRRYFKKDRSMELEPVLVMPAVATTYGAFQVAFGGATAVEGVEVEGAVAYYVRLRYARMRDAYVHLRFGVSDWRDRRTSVDDRAGRSELGSSPRMAAC